MLACHSSFLVHYHRSLPFTLPSVFWPSPDSAFSGSSFKTHFMVSLSKWWLVGNAVSHAVAQSTREPSAARNLPIAFSFVQCTGPIFHD
jgi:hypothetical protein